MSVIDTFRAPVVASPAGFFSKVAAALMAWNDARATRNALGNLSDRELLDIGLHRGDIERVARGL